MLFNQLINNFNGKEIVIPDACCESELLVPELEEFPDDEFDDCLNNMLGAITVAKLWISILEPVSSSISENEATQLKK